LFDGAPVMRRGLPLGATLIPQHAIVLPDAMAHVGRPYTLNESFIKAVTFVRYVVAPASPGSLCTWVATKLVAGQVMVPSPSSPAGYWLELVAQHQTVPSARRAHAWSCDSIPSTTPSRGAPPGTVISVWAPAAE
jgi:hypothetical protein